jgi:hypothetical protein
METDLIHTFGPYDFEVDTSNAVPSAVAASVLTARRAGTRRRALWQGISDSRGTLSRTCRYRHSSRPCEYALPPQLCNPAPPCQAAEYGSQRARMAPGRPNLSAGGTQPSRISAGHRYAECRCRFIMKPAIDIVIRPAWEQEANTWPR